MACSGACRQSWRKSPGPPYGPAHPHCCPASPAASPLVASLGKVMEWTLGFVSECAMVLASSFKPASWPMHCGTAGSTCAVWAQFRTAALAEPCPTLCLELIRKPMPPLLLHLPQPCTPITCTLSQCRSRPFLCWRLPVGTVGPLERPLEGAGYSRRRAAWREKERRLPWLRQAARPSARLSLALSLCMQTPLTPLH